MALEIEHTHLPIRGLNLHVAQVGKSDLGTVLFLHGFPEIWYSWRHQMQAVAAAGYRAIAPDCRGYGLSDQPPEHEAASFDDLVADVLAILDALDVPKAFLVAKDFGARPAYDFALQHPERTRGVVSLGAPYSPGPMPFYDRLPEGFYIHRWRETGRAEADFGRYDVRRVVRTIYVLFSGAEIPIAKEGQETMDLADLSTPLPEWFTEEDLDVYAKLYEKTGFRYPLRMPYRAIRKIPTGGLDAKFQVPVFIVMGEKDYAFKFPGLEAALRGGAMDNFMPDLKVTYIPEGCHFVQEQFPEQVNELLLAFLKDHLTCHRSRDVRESPPLFQQDPTLEQSRQAAMAQEIEHTHLPIRGINLHVAQVGRGELGTVVFLHGFPEIWYSWRHQMLAVAAAGYRAVAPDCRGYGLSDQPPEQEEEEASCVWDDLVADVAFLVGMDFGAMPAYEFALQHPERTRGVVCLGVPFSPVPFSFFHTMPEGFYLLRWGEPGRAEADFGRYDVRRVVRTIYVLFSGAEIPIAKEGQEIMDLADLSTPLPEWFTEEDLDAYAKLYEKSGFRYPLQMPYRSLHKMPQRLDAKFQVPVLMVMGEKDYAFKLPGIEAALRGGAMESFMPDLKIPYIPEGSHFVQEQLPEQVNELLLAFLKDHPVAA
ncbi:hypothetical protein U9M48_009614 [Paspalum notatum var. saurae]